MKVTKCDKCGQLWDKAYINIQLCSPDTQAVVQAFDICRECMVEGVLFRHRRDTPALPPGGPNGAALN